VLLSLLNLQWLSSPGLRTSTGSSAQAADPVRTLHAPPHSAASRDVAILLLPTSTSITIEPPSHSDVLRSTLHLGHSVAHCPTAPFHTITCVIPIGLEPLRPVNCAPSLAPGHRQRLRLNLRPFCRPSSFTHNNKFPPNGCRSTVGSDANRSTSSSQTNSVLNGKA
jgi:hypothetical protein